MGLQSPLYRVTLDLRYRVVSGGLVLAAGSGQTNLMSSHELVFAGDVPVKQGVSVEVSVSWPAVLDGHVRLQLVIFGRVSAVEGKWITVRIDRYEFRTRAPAYQPQQRSGARKMGTSRSEAVLAIP